jgi:hypothetical protein
VDAAKIFGNGRDLAAGSGVDEAYVGVVLIDREEGLRARGEGEGEAESRETDGAQLELAHNAGSLIQEQGAVKGVALDGLHSSRAAQEILQRIVNHGIQLLVMTFGVKSGPLVQIVAEPDIETTLKWGVRRLSFFFAEAEILIHGLFEISLKGVYIRAFVGDGVTNAYHPAMQDAIFSAVQDRAVIALVFECLAH